MEWRRSKSWANRLAAAFARADTDGVVDVEHEDLAVADLAGITGASGMDNCLNCRLDEGVIDGDLELELGQQTHLELRPTVHFRKPALPAAAADVGDGHEVNVAF